ncbi:MAG: hypothetical protein AAGF25_14385 [Pseudomonadota bacterium]
MRNVLFVLASIWAMLLMAPGFAQSTELGSEIESVYSKLDLDGECKPYDLYEQGGSFFCPGYSGYGVLFAEGDLRQSVFYGFVGEWFAEGAFESFSGFNYVSGTIEWRLKGGVPFATIMRWFISSGDGDGTNDGQVLVVSKVAQPGIGDGCVVGYVDALENADANVMAREIADELASDFMCRIEDPVFHGKEGLAAGFPVRTFGP